MTLTREQAMEFAEDKPSNPSDNETFGSISQRRYSRRGVLKGALMTSCCAGAMPCSRIPRLSTLPIRQKRLSCANLVIIMISLA